MNQEQKAVANSSYQIIKRTSPGKSFIIRVNRQTAAGHALVFLLHTPPNGGLLCEGGATFGTHSGTKKGGSCPIGGVYVCLWEPFATTMSNPGKGRTRSGWRWAIPPQDLFRLLSYHDPRHNKAASRRLSHQTTDNILNPYAGSRTDSLPRCASRTSPENSSFHERS